MPPRFGGMPVVSVRREVVTLLMALESVSVEGPSGGDVVDGMRADGGRLVPLDAEEVAAVSTATPVEMATAIRGLRHRALVVRSLYVAQTAERIVDGWGDVDDLLGGEDDVR